MSRRDIALLALFAIYTSTVVLWLLGGLAPVLSATSPTVLATFAGWGEGSNALASLSRKVVQTSTEAPRGATVLIDYIISVLGLGFALLIVSLRPPRSRCPAPGGGNGGDCRGFQPTESQRLRDLARVDKAPRPPLHSTCHSRAGVRPRVAGVS